MDPKEKIARRLIALRIELGQRIEGKPKGYSQAAFAEKLKLSRSVYNPFERLGNKRIITIEAAARIRQRYGIPTDWLYFGAIPQDNDIILKIGPDPIIEAEKEVPRAGRRKSK